MAARTPIVKTVALNGHECAVHACPWPLYRKIYGTGEKTDTLGLVEEVVRECVEPTDGQELDVIGTSSRPQISRLFEIAVSDEGKPDF